MEPVSEQKRLWDGIQQPGIFNRGVQDLRLIIASHWSLRGFQISPAQKRRAAASPWVLHLWGNSLVMWATAAAVKGRPSPPLQLIGQLAALRDHQPRQKPVSNFKCSFFFLFNLSKPKYRLIIYIKRDQGLKSKLKNGFLSFRLVSLPFYSGLNILIHTYKIQITCSYMLPKKSIPLWCHN